MKVLLHYTAGPALAHRLSELRQQGLQVVTCPEADEAAFAGQMADTEVLWHVLKPLDRAAIEAAPKLRLVQKIGTGVNTIDLEAARARGIAVCNMPGTNSRAVAEMTLLLMLATLRRLAEIDPACRAGLGWSLAPGFPERVGELGGRTVGLVGYGDVPRLLAPILRALGARVLYTARAPKPDAAGEYRSLDALLAESDVVSLHVPLTPETEGLMDEDAFARLKPRAVLVNTARGGLVDEAALMRALESGRLRGAGLDVFADEPVEDDHPLLARTDVVVTPHVAWLTPETWARSLGVAVENCRRLQAGEELLHRVV
jgi:phosphoglycerate dehydrogenase-like enzyme